MRNLVLGVILGACIASIAFWVWIEKNSESSHRLLSAQSQRQSAQKIESILDKVEADKSNKLYNSNSDNLTSEQQVESIDQILKIQSEIKQTEMLYVIASRSQAREVIDLIKQADAISNYSDRSSALAILFSRLTEISPDLALEAIKDQRFVGDDYVMQSIWRTWARHDFDSALLAVQRLTPFDVKQAAIRAMYSANGVLDSEQSTRIKEATRIEPTNWAIKQAIEAIARKSISNAIAQINQLSSLVKQNEAAHSVGAIAAKREPEQALNYANLLNSGKARKKYRSRVLETIGVNAPYQTLESWRTDEYAIDTSRAANSAFAQLTQDDFDYAKAFADQMPASKAKSKLIKTLVFAAAKQNSVEAIELANLYEKAGERRLVQALISEMTRASPQLALTAIQASSNLQDYQTYLAQVIGALAEMDPQVAIVELNNISNQKDRTLANSELIRAWASTNINAALRYAIELDELGSNMGFYKSNFEKLDIDLAMRFIDKFSSDQYQSTSYPIVQQIANKLSKANSPAEVVHTIQQYESNKQIKTLKRMVVSNFYHADSSKVMSLIDSLWSGDKRERAYIEFAEQNAYTEPELTANLHTQFEKTATKKAILNSAFNAWGRQDKNAASRQARRLPQGELRDTGILAMSNFLSIESSADQNLIGLIDDPNSRERAVINSLFSSQRDNPENILRLAKKSDLSAAKLALIEQVLGCQNVDRYDLDKTQQCFKAMTELGAGLGYY